MHCYTYYSLLQLQNMDSGSDYSSSPSESVHRMTLPCAASIMEEEISQGLQRLKEKSSEVSISCQSHQNIPEERGELMDVTSNHSQFETMIQNIITETESLLKTVLNQELNSWITEQRRVKYMNVVPDKSIDTIEAWCEDLVEIIWKTGEQLHGAGKAGVLEIIPLQLKVKTLLEELVNRSLVVVEEPYPIVQKGTKISKTILLRFLCSSVFRYLKIDLSKSENQPVVEMSLINDEQACHLTANITKPTKTSGTYQNNVSKLEYQPKYGHKVCALFRDSKLSEVNKDDWKGFFASHKTDVTDKKYYLHFYCEFSAPNFHFKTSTVSSPLVVVSHRRVQEPQAWATINWENAFHEQNILPYRIPTKVTWSQLSEMLNCRFRDATEGEGLSKENLAFLREKIFSIGSPNTSDVISWRRFCKLQIQNYFSFWDWFYASMKLTERVAKRYWNEGYIRGFVSETAAKEIIKKCQPGTFLLRFSETVLGGLSIVFMDTDGSVKIYPFRMQELLSKSLADKLKDCNKLHFLHPSTPKDAAFGNFYSKEKS